MLLVARQAQTWEQALVLALGVVAVVVAFERWTAGDLGRVAVPCLAVAAVVWPYGVLVVGGEVQAAYYAVAVVGCLVVPSCPGTGPGPPSASSCTWRASVPGGCSRRAR